MAHIWTVIPERSNDRLRVYRCARCEAGPVHVPGVGFRISQKNAIRDSAARAGIPRDCASETVRKVMES